MAGMKCRKCGSTETQRVTTRDPQWSVGAQRCQACGHQDHWLRFLDPPDLEAESLLDRTPSVLSYCLKCAKELDLPGKREELTVGGHLHSHCDRCGRVFAALEQAFNCRRNDG